MKKLLLSICLFASLTVFAQTKVSDADLNTFSKVYTVMLAENHKAQNTIPAIIEEEGLDILRFSEIEASVRNNPHDGAEPTSDELTKHKKVHDRIGKIQKDFEVIVEKEIKAQGWTQEKYEEIVTAISASEELQNKLQKIMTEGK